MSWIENSGHDDLDIDQAYLNITTDSPFYLYQLPDECYKCSFSYSTFINNSQLIKLSSTYGTYLRLYNNYKGSDVEDFLKDGMICEVRPKNFGEFGVYQLSLQQNECTIDTIKEPANIYLPVVIIASAIVCLAVLCSVISFLSIKFGKSNLETVPEEKKRRVRALDTFRGLCIVIMIFVNYGGGDYKLFNHATWNGLNIADLVFPWFMWIMGVCIPISVKSQLKRGETRLNILGSILQRSVILFLLGLMLNTVGVGSDLSTIRIFGVLQRFAISYFVIASLVTLFNFHNEKDQPPNAVTDIIRLSFIWVLMILLVITHSFFTFYYPVPGCKMGYLGPGGLHEHGSFKNCTGGVAGYFDKLLLGRHIYQQPTANAIYKSGPFDPEGPFATMLSTFQVFLGVQAGTILITFTNVQWIKRWVIWGCTWGILGAVLCQARQEGGWIPINKNLWSLSFVFVTSSLAFLIMSIFVYIIDVKRWWSGAPFIYPGMNSILLFVGHEVGSNLFPWHLNIGIRTHFMSSIEAIWGTLLWTLISYICFKKKFFISL